MAEDTAVVSILRQTEPIAVARLSPLHATPAAAAALAAVERAGEGNAAGGDGSAVEVSKESRELVSKDRCGNAAAKNASLAYLTAHR